jgi:hypothetical protein
MDSKHRAKILNKSYLYNPQRQILTFEDNISYTLREAVLIAKSSPTALTAVALHKLKEVFDGEIIDYGQKENPLEIRGKLFREEVPGAYREVLGDRTVQRVHKVERRNRVTRKDSIKDCEVLKLDL